MQLMNYEVGKIYRNIYGDTYQILEIDDASGLMHYIFLPSEIKGALEPSDQKKIGRSYKIPYSSVTILTDYQYEGRPCEDCLAFCKQQCQSKTA